MSDPLSDLDAALAGIERHNARVLALAARRRAQTPTLAQLVEVVRMSAQNLSDAVAQADANVAALEGEAAQTHALVETLRGARDALQAQRDANAAQNAALQAQIDANTAQNTTLLAAQNAINDRIAAVTGGLDADQTAGA